MSAENIITLKLLADKTIAPLDAEGFLQTEGSQGKYVIASESNATKIVISYPADYATYAFSAILINSNGAGENVNIPAIGDSANTINISSTMTYAGYTKIFIKAVLGSEVIRWMRFDLKVWSTSPEWTKEAEQSWQDMIEASLALKADIATTDYIMAYLNDHPSHDIYVSGTTLYITKNFVS